MPASVQRSRPRSTVSWTGQSWKAFLGLGRQEQEVGQGLTGYNGSKPCSLGDAKQSQLLSSAWLCATSRKGINLSKLIEAAAMLPRVKVKSFPCPVVAQQKP